MQNRDEINQPSSSRRSFLKTSGAALVGGAITARFGNLPAVHAAGSDEIRIGLIGCGERGTGAVENAFSSAQGVKLVAVADAFKDHVEKSLTYLSQFKEKVDVPAERQFTGLSAFKDLLGLEDVNYVILADGYTSTTVNTTLMTDVNNYLAMHFSEPFGQPYLRYKNFVNICLFKTVSQSDGISQTGAVDTTHPTIFSCYGDDGPWADRRGFDSLVQTASGFNLAEAEAFGSSEPRALPAQALDQSHAQGRILA